MLRTISPIDGAVVVERPIASDAQIESALNVARAAQPAWRQTPLAERAALLGRFCEEFEARRALIARELTLQIGRPIRFSPGEVSGTVERARHMIAIAADALRDIGTEPKPGFHRYIRREPLGVVLTLAAWNYPCLIAVNSVVPALMAGNAVLLKPSAQTPLSAERFAECLAAAGLPEGVFQVLHLGHDGTARLLRDPRIDFVAFTGSVAGGRMVQRAASERFIGLGLELGGCDPVYVRHDADLAHAAEHIAEGVYFNSGQSCCGLQRLYVHRRVYDEFLGRFIERARDYVLGNPLEPGTTLGPVVRTEAAATIRAQIAASVQAGAYPALDAACAADRVGTPYVAPQLLLGVDHSMPIMREEIFGPVAGLMPVRSDEEAVRYMNDSALGLTAAVWTADAEAGMALGAVVETGTFFMNRCDYLDPALAWTGVKDSGHGCALSRLGYEQLTRPKSFHLRIQT
jgi:acyl-CoA reductase-like NAD-dependent aldehyde dehydrogenase